MVTPCRVPVLVHLQGLPPLKTWRIWLLSLLLLPWAACAEHLRLVADSWPPFTDQRLAGNGVAAELVGTALSRAGYTSDYREVPWQRAVLGLQRGDYDVLITAWYSREREAFGYFSAPYLVNRIRVVQRKGAGIVFNQLADLHAHQIAVRRGYAYSPAFMADDQLQTVEVSSFENAARMVHRGRVTLALEDEYVARFLFGNSLKAIADDLEGGMGELVQLLADGLHDARMTVSGVEHGDAGAKVDVLAALDIPERGVLGARGMEVAHDTHAPGRGGKAALLEGIVRDGHGGQSWKKRLTLPLCGGIGTRKKIHFGPIDGANQP